ncbi:MAG: hypothetical protein OEM59_18160 [Rhodospirillales bacterium]|nr:hypothetical protein [Rhodospirillales bacterium]
MYRKTLALLIACIAIGSAVGFYVDRNEPAPTRLAQGPGSYDAGLILSCMAAARAELERLDSRYGYRERDLRRACETAALDDGLDGGHP